MSWKLLICDKPHYPFELPEGWAWTTLGEIGSWQSGATPSRMNKDYYGGNIPWLKTGDLNDGTITYIPEYITQRALEETSLQQGRSAYWQNRYSSTPSKHNISFFS